MAFRDDQAADDSESNPCAAGSDLNNSTLGRSLRPRKCSWFYRVLQLVQRVM